GSQPRRTVVSSARTTFTRSSRRSAPRPAAHRSRRKCSAMRESLSRRGSCWPESSRLPSCSTAATSNQRGAYRSRTGVLGFADPPGVSASRTIERNLRPCRGKHPLGYPAEHRRIPLFQGVTGAQLAHTQRSSTSRRTATRPFSSGRAILRPVIDELRAAADALNRGDPEPFVSLFAENAEGPGPAQGHRWWHDTPS